MTTDEKLAAILAAVQTDPGNRGLGRDPHDNLFTATKGDFEAACRSIVEHSKPALDVLTGFYIASGNPPSFETDGPLGAVFVARALRPLGIRVCLIAEIECGGVMAKGLTASGWADLHRLSWGWRDGRHVEYVMTTADYPGAGSTHLLAIERAGPNAEGQLLTMRGRDITELMQPAQRLFDKPRISSIGIGDGGNEIGMGKIPHETIVKNIPNGDLIHCRVPTDHLIVAGVSNWGAYALAAGIYVLRGVKPPPDLFDPDRERAILEVMVREGPLVDGVTGKQTATVDGLSWDEYAKPLVRIRQILET
ncbi:MAG: DUF4392 domain-containing protein [Planctomycetes bacterium]|nr:DUF4392 domain-containing protein [Planctomycetota bacterium]